MQAYDHKKLEKKWQTIWEKDGVYHAENNSKKPKYYSLIEFPYPSGDGLHVGHPRPYIGMDIISRKRRLEGYNVLYPIGWDAFGLPTENFAIKTGKDPRVVTKKNSDTFRGQIKSLGISFDWSREINTTDPKYYKWTQWIFLQFLKKGLAYKAKMSINWCPKDKIGLANEEVVSGCCERCGTAVEKREKEQWMLAITKYADRLHKDLDDVDYLPQIKLGQRNWIGRSEGAEISFQLVADSFQEKNLDSKLKAKSQQPEAINVFTTRPDTIYGATYLVLAPEHELVSKLKLKIKNWSSVMQYILATKAKNDLDGTKEEKEKTGIELQGIEAINPATGEPIPVWIADYVLSGYGTGAIMAVPAHDERDFEFAKKYDLPIKRVVEPKFVVSTGDAAFHENEEVVFRNVICAVIRNPQNDQYLCVSWKQFKMHGLVTGGTEEGENIVDAAKREILEETGYKNLKLVKNPNFAIHTFFYHRAKKVNRHARFNYLFFDLIDEEKGPISEGDSKLHEVVWVPKKELKDFFTVAEGEFIINFINNPDYIHTGSGILHDSGRFDGLDSEKVKKQIINFVGGKEKITFKLRDWVFSRQRYWGEPIPVIHCSKCGMVPVPEKDLPVELPKVKNYQPTDSGESPLANITKWVNVKCPKCKGKAKRETDTMPNWAGSSWYYLRYVDPKNNNKFVDPKKLAYWSNLKLQAKSNNLKAGLVDWYNGGNEHTTLHLLYSRFWHKFLYDLKLVPTNEPYMKRTSHGMILGEGGVKMSKSLGNVINPDDIVKTYGADTLRVYEMFMGPFDQSVAWSTESIIGARRFIEKVWRIGLEVKKSIENLEGGRFHLKDGGSPRNSLLTSSLTQIKNSSAFLHPAGGSFRGQNFSSGSLQKLLHRTIKKVSEDIEGMNFNTAISSMMILGTEMEKACLSSGVAESVSVEDYKKFLQILSPFAPHMTEELWSLLGEKDSINLSNWPKWDPNLIQDEEIKIVVQINGKVRGEIMIQAEEKEESVKEKVLRDAIVLKHIDGKEVKRVVYVRNRLINIVI